MRLLGEVMGPRSNISWGVGGVEQLPGLHRKSGTGVNPTRRRRLAVFRSRVLIPLTVMITAHSLTKRYGDATAVDNLTFEVPPVRSPGSWGRTDRANRRRCG